MKKYLVILLIVFFIPLHAKAMFLTKYNGKTSSSICCMYGETMSRSWGGDGSISVSSPSGRCATVSYSGSACGTAIVSASCTGDKSRTISETVTYKSDWTERSGTYIFDSKPPGLTSTGNVAYAHCNQRLVDGVMKYVCDNGYVRCGGSTGGSSGSTPKKCYRKVINEAGHVYDYKWTNKNPGSGYSVVSAIKNEKDCIIDNPNYCNPTVASTIPTVTINKCDDNLSFSLEDGDNCSVASKTEFYDISCSNTVNVKYIPGFTGNAITLKKGQGFGFEIELTTTKICHGSFNESAWNEAYDRANSLIERAKKAKDNKEKAFYEDLKNEIVKIATAYNNWSISDKVGSDAMASIEYNYFDEGAPDNIRFSDNFEEKNKTSHITEKSLTNKRKLKNNVEVYDFSNNKIETTVIFQPKEVLLDKRGGVITTSKTNSISAGNKFFTSMKTKTGSYPMRISVNNIGGINNFTLVNDKCSFNILGGEDIRYRIIDVADPFINNTVVGENWENDDYSFKPIIKSDVWGTKGLYIFNFNGEQMSLIKSDNKLDKDSYLGTCFKDETMMSEINKVICKELEK